MVSATQDAADLRRILDEIADNHRVFDATPAWRLRKRYKLVVANEALFASLGFTFPPLFRGSRGIVRWWITR